MLKVTISDEALDREPRVVDMIGTSRSTMWLMIADGRFPPPIKSLGTNRNVWPRSETQAIVKARIGGATDGDLRQLVAELVQKRKRAIETEQAAA